MDTQYTVLHPLSPYGPDFFNIRIRISYILYVLEVVTHFI